jgi:hypothetical protein
MHICNACSSFGACHWKSQDNNAEITVFIWHWWSAGRGTESGHTEFQVNISDRRFFRTTQYYLHTYTACFMTDPREDDRDPLGVGHMLHYSCLPACMLCHGTLDASSSARPARLVPCVLSSLSTHPLALDSWTRKVRAHYTATQSDVRQNRQM